MSAVRDGTLAVLPFRNLSSTDELDWFATATAELLATHMANSPMVTVVSPERVRLILENAAEDEADPMKLMEQAQIGFSITGSIINSSSRIRVESRLIDNGERNSAALRIWRSELTQDDLYTLVAELDRKYRQYIEVRAISEHAEEEWMQELTRYPVDAYRAYARGREQLSAAQWSPAIENFLKAVSIDSTFVSAWVDLSSCYWNTGEIFPAWTGHSTVPWNCASTPALARDSGWISTAQRRVRRWPTHDSVRRRNATN